MVALMLKTEEPFSNCCNGYACYKFFGILIDFKS